MPERFFAPHAAGFGPLVQRLAERDCPLSSVRSDGDNAILIDYVPQAPGGPKAALEPVALLSYCRGLFRVLGEAEGGLERGSRALVADRRLGSALSRSLSSGRDSGRGSGARSFVLRSFGPDDPASMPQGPRRALESLIAEATGARPDSERPAREYRLQERADGRLLFLERLLAGAARSQESPPRPGELPRTTCRLLAEMTGPRPDDVFLDPFCGYGGIALERALAGPYRFVFAQDIDPAKAEAVRESLDGKAFERRRKTIFPKARDALDPTAFEAGFVTAIATDPPWGLYGASAEGGAGPGGADAIGPAGAEALLAAFVAQTARMMAPGGRLVMLVSRHIDAAAIVGGFRDRGSGAFELREKLDVLISGKKARAIRFDRT